MRAIPNFTVLVPCDAVETNKAVRAAAAYNGPVYIRLGRADIPVITTPDTPFEIGKAFVMKQGTDISLIACGMMVGEAMKAAETLAEVGINAEVVNVSSIKPLDVETIVASAKKTGAVVTAEEHSIVGGLGGAVAEVLGEECPVPMKRVGMKDCFGESGQPAELLKKYGMTAEDIVEAAKLVLSRKGR
jgi:transketolase